MIKELIIFHYFRCLEPGKYASHIQRWLQPKFYEASQLHIIDGEKLKSDPIPVMNELQHFLNVQPLVDYEKLLKFDPTKGFYCPVVSSTGGIKCLGKGKGRQYPPMDKISRKFLDSYYRLDNERLLKLLTTKGYPIHKWLERDLNDEEQTL